ncbi:MAG TPA: hypothetical protein DIU10_17365 [Sulfitobacter sp.]|nr:hypothetical protein [Sulfitobacter sp.]
MITVVPWIIGAAGLGISVLWKDGAPSWLAGAENRHSDYGYSFIAIIFGTGALYAERQITGFSDGFVIEAFALLIYWLICRGIMGGPS